MAESVDLNDNYIYVIVLFKENMKISLAIIEAPHHANIMWEWRNNSTHS